MVTTNKSLETQGNLGFWEDCYLLIKHSRIYIWNLYEGFFFFKCVRKDASNQHIRMISERKWSNDAENSALHQSNKLHFRICANRKQLFEIAIKFHNITVFFNNSILNKCSPGEHKRFIFKNATNLKHLNRSAHIWLNLIHYFKNFQLLHQSRPWCFRSLNEAVTCLISKE